jgi:hypothetical protein
MTDQNPWTDWAALFEVFHQFRDDYPQLAISGATRKACNRFARAYQCQLMQCGALAKTSHGRWLAHRRVFPVAAFALWIGQDPMQAVAEYRAVPQHASAA